MQKLLLGSVLALAVIVSWVVGAGGQNATTTTLTIRVPGDAKVYVANRLTKQTGTTRIFITPPLDPMSKYAYDVKVEVVRQGKVVSHTEHVRFQAGQLVSVDLSTVGADSPTPLPPPKKLPKAAESTKTVEPVKPAEPVKAAESAEAPVKADAGWPRKLVKD